MATAPSVVTTAMKPLRAAGHVVLEETPGGDARRSGYHLSEEGHAFFTSVSGHILIAEELLVGPLSEAERGTLRRLLQRLAQRSEEHTSEIQSLMGNSYAVFCLKKNTNPTQIT